MPTLDILLHFLSAIGYAAVALQGDKMAEDLNAEIEAIQEAIKAHMTEADADTLTAGQYKVTWKPVTSTRIDTTALRKDLPEIWQEYGKTTTTRRFSVALAN